MHDEPVMPWTKLPLQWLRYMICITFLLIYPFLFWSCLISQHPFFSFLFIFILLASFCIFDGNDAMAPGVLGFKVPAQLLICLEMLPGGITSCVYIILE